MSDCDFGCDLVCVHCGYRARKPGTRRTCSVVRPPSLVAKLRNYEAALSRWLGAGRPVRSDTEVSTLLEVCQSNHCGLYRDGTCGACWCPVSASRWAIRNKLRMATESCPKGLWGDGVTPAAPRKVRVGFVTPNLLVGGVESWLCSLARRWQESGAVECVGVAHVGTDGLVDRVLTDRLAQYAPIVSASEIPGGHRVTSPVMAAATVAGAADVLVVWSCAVDTLHRVARPGLEIVGVSHGCHDWWMREAEESGLVSRWVAVHEAAAAVCPRPATVIHNGIDLERCQSELSREEARRRLDIPVGRRVAGYVGRFSPEKRIRSIEAAVGFLPAEWCLLFAGRGPEAPIASDRVIVVPPVEQIGDVWRACDVAVVASEAEGYCLSAVEALAAGVPLASTPVGVVADLGMDVAVIPQPARPDAIAVAIVQAAAQGISDRLASWVQSQSDVLMAGRWAEWLVKSQTPRH